MILLLQDVINLTAISKNPGRRLVRYLIPDDNYYCAVPTTLWYKYLTLLRVSFLKDYPSSSSQSNSLPSFSKINIPYLPTFQKTFFDTDMSSSNSLTQSNSSPRHQETKSKDFKDSNQFMSNSYFHPVYFCHNDLDEPSRISRIANDDITEKLSEMKLQRPSHSSRKPTKQKKVNVSPYYRKSLLSPPRTPEVFRKPRNRMQIMSTVKVEVKEPQKTGNLKDTQHS